MTLAEYALFSFRSLFPIVDPIAAVPAFLAMTARDTVAQRIRMAQAADWTQRGVLLGCIVAIGVVSYIILALAGRGASRWLGPIAEKIITRLMGLLLAALAIQFIFNALKSENGLPGR